MLFQVCVVIFGGVGLAWLVTACTFGEMVTRLLYERGVAVRRIVMTVFVREKDRDVMMEEKSTMET